MMPRIDVAEVEIAAARVAAVTGGDVDASGKSRGESAVSAARRAGSESETAARRAGFARRWEEAAQLFECAAAERKAVLVASGACSAEYGDHHYAVAEMLGMARKCREASKAQVKRWR